MSGRECPWFVTLSFHARVTLILIRSIHAYSKVLETCQGVEKSLPDCVRETYDEVLKVSMTKPGKLFIAFSEFISKPFQY